MLPSALRIRKTRDYSRIYKFGRQVSSPRLRIFFARGQAGRSRYGLVISKKSTKVGAAAGKIVERNRIKRILRVETRRLGGELVFGFDVVVAVRQGTGRADAAKLREEFRGLLRKSGLLK